MIIINCSKPHPQASLFSAANECSDGEWKERGRTSYSTQMSPYKKQVVPLNYVLWQLVTHSLSHPLSLFSTKKTERLHVNTTTLNRMYILVCYPEVLGGGV